MAVPLELVALSIHLQVVGSLSNGACDNKTEIRSAKDATARGDTGDEALD